MKNIYVVEIKYTEKGFGYDDDLSDDAKVEIGKAFEYYEDAEEYGKARSAELEQNGYVADYDVLTVEYHQDGIC